MVINGRKQKVFVKFAIIFTYFWIFLNKYLEKNKKNRIFAPLKKKLHKLSIPNTNFFRHEKKYMQPMVGKIASSVDGICP